MNGPADAWEIESLAPSPRNGFEGRIALITDGTQGVSRGLALSLAARGVVPVITYDCDDGGAQETVAAIAQRGISTISIHADLLAADDIDSVFDTIEERFGRIDFFVSNARASTSRPLIELEPDGLERSFNANVRALVLGAQRAVPLMDRGGRIVVLSSYRSRHASPLAASHGAALAAADEWARQIAVELAPLDINVNVLMLGIIESDSSSAVFDSDPAVSLDRLGPWIPKQRAGFVQEAVDCAVFLLSPAAGYVTGATLVVDGGLTATLPPVQSGMTPG